MNRQRGDAVRRKRDGTACFIRSDCKRFFFKKAVRRYFLRGIQNALRFARGAGNHIITASIKAVVDDCHTNSAVFHCRSGGERVRAVDPAPSAAVMKITSLRLFVTYPCRAPFCTEIREEPIFSSTLSHIIDKRTRA